MKRRDRDIIVRKMRNNEKLKKKEEKMLNSDIDNHMWYHCTKTTSCMNSHCWIAVRIQICTQCKAKTKHCSCAE